MRRSKFGDWRHVFDLCNAQLSHLNYWLRSMAQMPIDLPSTDDLILVVYGLYLTFPLNQVRFPDEDNGKTVSQIIASSPVCCQGVARTRAASRSGQ